MKGSILVGGAESAAIQSQDNSPCGSIKEPKGAKGTRFREVAYMIPNRNGKVPKDNNFVPNDVPQIKGSK